MQRLVRRMTRFFVTTPPEETLRSLTQTLRKHSYAVRKNAPGMVSAASASGFYPPPDDAGGAALDASRVVPPNESAGAACAAGSGSQRASCRV